MLTFIGYDKEGHPIYSGSNHYFTKKNAANKTNVKNGAKKLIYFSSREILLL